ncbi:MAG: hypothetical protein KGJ80_14840 [Chloroflexota bacterium]|nr:hypothetical protein [Chloroflexota bacterium]
MGIGIPQPMKLEHEELHNELKQAVGAGGRIGEAATQVAHALHAHFEKEEEYALPPLGLLPALAQGQVTAEMAKVLPLTDKLKADLPHMLDEHKAIVAALNKLTEVAKQENKPQYVHFADKLMLHAQTEEQVSYPTAILVGEYVKLALKK